MSQEEFQQEMLKFQQEVLSRFDRLEAKFDRQFDDLQGQIASLAATVVTVPKLRQELRQLAV